MEYCRHNDHAHDKQIVVPSSRGGLGVRLRARTRKEVNPMTQTKPYALLISLKKKMRKAAVRGIRHNYTLSD